MQEDYDDEPVPGVLGWLLVEIYGSIYPHLYIRANNALKLLSGL